VLGTCLSPAALRKVVAKGKGHDLKGLSDRAVLEEAVRGAARHDDVGKLLHKALDRRYEMTIQHFYKAKSADEVFVLWEEALRCGHVPSAYWALLTHPAASDELRGVAYGDVHMFAHLVGVTKHPSFQRLTVLEADNAELTLTVEKQQEQLRNALVTLDATRQRLNILLAREPVQECRDPASLRAREEADETTALRALVADLQKRLATAEWRCAQVEQRYETAQTALSEANIALGNAHQEAQHLRDELAAVEAQLWTTHRIDGEKTCPLSVHLKGTRLLYVGGRSGHIQLMRAMVEEIHAELLHHDGGQEERKGLLPGLVSRADAVFFPVDCISHDAVTVVKRLCKQTGKPYLPLRSVSLTSFMAGLRQFTRLALEGVSPS
jgi:Uncharacterized protein conserved in bacteria (DUF2325)